jgi:hypothetical protein
MTVEIGESLNEPGYLKILLKIAAAALTGHSRASCEAIRVANGSLEIGTVSVDELADD